MRLANILRIENVRRKTEKTRNKLEALLVYSSYDSESELLELREVRNLTYPIFLDLLIAIVSKEPE